MPSKPLLTKQQSTNLVNSDVDNYDCNTVAMLYNSLTVFLKNVAGHPTVSTAIHTIGVMNEPFVYPSSYPVYNTRQMDQQ